MVLHPVSDGKALLIVYTLIGGSVYPSLSHWMGYLTKKEYAPACEEMRCNGIIKISREIRRDENIYSMRSQLGFTWARTDGHCRRNLVT